MLKKSVLALMLAAVITGCDAKDATETTQPAATPVASQSTEQPATPSEQSATKIGQPAATLTIEAGKQYQKMEQTIANAPQVMEVFSYGCGHCRQMDKLLPELNEALGQDVVQEHIVYDDGTASLAVLYYTGVIQLPKEKLHAYNEAIFSLLHDNHDMTQQQSTDKLAAIYSQFGILAPDQLDEQQVEKVSKHIQHAAQITKEARVQGVPSFYVNGEYQLLAGGHNSLEGMIDSIEQMVQLPHQIKRQHKMPLSK